MTAGKAFSIALAIVTLGSSAVALALISHGIRRALRGARGED